MQTNAVERIDEMVSGILSASKWISVVRGECENVGATGIGGDGEIQGKLKNKTENTVGRGKRKKNEINLRAMV